MPGKRAALLLFAVLLLAGCSEGDNVIVGGSDGGMIDPDPTGASISGEWSTSTTEVLDTCGFDPIPSFAPLSVEESGDSVIFTFSDGLGNCAESVRTRSGDTVTLNRTDTIDGGCGLVRVQSNMVYDFTDTTLSGVATHQYTVLDGACSNLPCTYQLAIGGTRCEGCWPGCATVASDGAGITSEDPSSTPTSRFSAAR